MGKAAKTGFYSSQHHRYIRIYLFENLRIYYRWIFWSHIVTTIRTISIFRTQTAVGCVLIDHRVHTARCNSKKEAWPSELLKVAEVTMPVGLRYYGHTVAFSFQYAAYDCCSKRGVVDISISTKEDNIQVVPTTLTDFLQRCWKKVGQLYPLFSLYLLKHLLL